MKPGERISGDIVPISPAAHDGSTMFFLFADVATGYMIAYTAKAKNSFLTAFIKAINTLKRYGHEVKIFRSDAEGRRHGPIPRGEWNTPRDLDT